MLHVPERQLADVHHALDAAQVHECPVVLERGDGAWKHRADLQPGPCLLGQRLLLLFEQRTAGRHQVGPPSAFVTCDAEAQVLPDEGFHVLDVAQVELRGGAESALTGDLYLDAALGDAGHQPFHRKSVGVGVLDLGAAVQVAAALAAEHERPGLLVLLDDDGLERISQGDRQLAVGVGQRFDVHGALGLGAERNERVLAGYGNNPAAYLVAHIQFALRRALLLALELVQECCEILMFSHKVTSLQDRSERVYVVPLFRRWNRSRACVR